MIVQPVWGFPMVWEPSQPVNQQEENEDFAIASRKILILC